jgi:uncharacterized protein YegP (UPF0339 family)
MSLQIGSNREKVLIMKRNFTKYPKITGSVRRSEIDNLTSEGRIACDILAADAEGVWDIGMSYQNNTMLTSEGNYTKAAAQEVVDTIISDLKQAKIWYAISSVTYYWSGGKGDNDPEPYKVTITMKRKYSNVEV